MTTRRRSRTLTFLAALAAAFVVLPLVGVAIRLPWSDAWSLATSATARRAAWVSLQTSVVAVVAGIALLSVFGRGGVIGQPLLEWWGVSITFTRTAVVIAQVFVSIPFLVLAVESSFRQLDAGLEDAARTLGASPMRVFVTVALPGARPAIVAGVALAWARSIGEFGASITFAGSFPGRTQTLPMSVYELVSTDYPAALSVSFGMMLVSVLVIASLRGRWMVAR
ncbi:MAG: ABC transporter permease subunit [Actinobacteria bacterium]|nr:ABC transporter permease subunit [Actinomycetota bacterium]